MSGDDAEKDPANRLGEGGGDQEKGNRLKGYD
jgi:hypothetical protein